ncbi:MAG: amidohydrolase family protein [Gemmatimonadaceae bacterium]
MISFKKKATQALLALIATMLPQILHAQLGSFNPPAGPRSTYVIRNAKIVPVVGAEIASGSIVISAGKIVAVGANVTVPAGAQIIEGTGLTVYPGLMDAGTSMGLSEIGQGAAATVDISEVGNFNPNAQAFFGVNPHSAHIGVTRVVGITHVLSHPTGGIISGQAVMMNLQGSTPPEMVVDQHAAMMISLPSSGFGGRGGRGGGGGGGGGAPDNSTQDVNRTRTRQLDSLRQFFKDADAYAKAFEAYEKDKTLPRPSQDVVLAAMVGAARGKMPVIFNADRVTDIRESVAFAEEMHVKPIIMGGRDAWQIAPFLKQHDVAVLLSSTMDLPTREDDPYDVNYAAAAKLQQAGVRFAITSGDAGSEVRNLPYSAGMSAAFGLSKTDALKSVTLWPAQILGYSDKLGSIEAGKMANLVVTNGDILEAKTETKFLFIDGRPVPLDSKHSVLFTQFKDRP